MRKSSRYVVAIICLSIVVLRLIFPELNFDLISLSLLAIATLAILINKPGNHFERIRRLKIGSLEVELQDLNKEVEKVEKNTIVKKDEPVGLSGPAISKEKTEFEITEDFSTNILKLSIEIEKILREIYEIHFKSSKERPLSVVNLINKLKTAEVLDGETSALLHNFWSLRNKAIHDHNYFIDKKDYMSFTDIGIRILRIIKSVKNNRLNGKLQHIGLG